MKKIPVLPIAAAVAAVLAVGWLGATHFTGQAVETRYNAQLDRVLAELPMLKVEERSYQRSLMSADARLVLRFAVPDLAGPDDDEDEAQDDEADAAQADVSEEAAKASKGAAQQRPKPPVVRLTITDKLAHGPFPGSMMPAATKIHSLVTAELLKADGLVAAVVPATGVPTPASSGSPAGGSPITLLKADTTIGLSKQFVSRFSSPAGDWSFDQGRSRVSWSGLEGESSGDAETMASRYSMQSPGFRFQAGSEGGDRAEVVMTTIRVEGDQKPSSSLLLAPGNQQMTVAQLKLLVFAADGNSSRGLDLADVTSTTAATQSGDLMDIRRTARGKGSFSGIQIDGFEVSEQWRRLHVPTVQTVVRKVLAIYKEDAPPKPQDMSGALMDDFKALLPHDPEYSIDKLALTLDGRTGTLSFMAGLKGATAELADNPIALATVANASADFKAPRAWIESLMASGTDSPIAQSRKQVSVLLQQGEQMGFLKIDGEIISSNVQFTRGKLDVNGKTVFSLPGVR